MQIKDLIPWARKDGSPEHVDRDNPIATLQKDMNELLDGFRIKAEQIGNLELPWGGGTAQSDVVEIEDAVEVSIELPGMDMQDVEIMVTDDFLTIKGEKKVERHESKKGYYLSERTFGAIYRSIPLPPGVDTDQADARFQNGVLTVRLPQTEEARAKVKRIEVNKG